MSNNSVRFKKGSRNVTLSQSAISLTNDVDYKVGLDNQGPSTALGASLYPLPAELRSADGEPWSSAGLVINQATVVEPTEVPVMYATCDPQTGGPPGCHNSS